MSTTNWMTYNKKVLSQFWRTEVQSQGVGRATLLNLVRENPFSCWWWPAILRVPWLVDVTLQSLSSHGLLPLVSLCLFPSSYKDTSPTQWGIHPNPVWPHLNWLHLQLAISLLPNKVTSEILGVKISISFGRDTIQPITGPKIKRQEVWDAFPKRRNIDLDGDPRVLPHLSLSPKAHLWCMCQRRSSDFIVESQFLPLKTEIIMPALLILKDCWDDQMRYGNWLR